MKLIPTERWKELLEESTRIMADEIIKGGFSRIEGVIGRYFATIQADLMKLNERKTKK